MARLIFASCVICGCLLLSAHSTEGDVVNQTLCYPRDSHVTVNINFVHGSCEATGNTPDQKRPTSKECDSSPDKCRETHPNACQSNPCLYGGECNTTQNYHCFNCPFPMGGQNCEELKCDTFCFRHKDIVYFAYPDHPSTWTQAHEHCSGKGMTMAIIKDQTTHGVIKGKLQAFYYGRESIKHAFWIGLRRSSTSDPWKWVDGTTFDYIEGWAANKPTADLCVNIANGSPFHFSMDDDPCNSNVVGGWHLFPLCQQKFSFLIN